MLQLTHLAHTVNSSPRAWEDAGTRIEIANVLFLVRAAPSGTTAHASGGDTSI